MSASLDTAGPLPAAEFDGPGRTAVVRRARPARRVVIVGGIALLAVALGVAYLLMPASSQATDNAYVAADATAVAPRVHGQVTQVLVEDNQDVRAGEPLVVIDPEEFDTRVATAKADLADATAGLAAANAALASLGAEELLAAANVRAAESAIRAAKAEAERALADARRYDNLVASGSVSARDADAYRAAAVTAEQDVTRVSALFDVARESEAVTRARRATLVAAQAQAAATIGRAQAALELARQDRRHTVVVAPFDGIVGNRQVQRGDYVQPGSRLLTLVPLHDRYVTANFKETQIGNMRAGQRARIEIDALPGHDFLGTVQSLAPGSGSRFALLPFEPGTGNFTKIVQRVPVRVRFDADQPGLEQLRPGLSATVKVALRN